VNTTAPQLSLPGIPAPASIWITEVLRLTRWELFLAWRRIMAKVLIILLVVFYAITIGFISLIIVQTIGQPEPSVQCPPNAAGCVEPSPQELQEMRAQRARDIALVTDQVTFPTSLSYAVGFTRVVGLVLVSILAGTLVGSEYGFGTQRLALSRGTSRLQILTAQTLALAVIAMIVAAGMLLLGTLVGVTVGPSFGLAVSAPSFGGWMEIVKYFFAFAFSLFAYELVALAAATLGKGTAAGLGLAFGWIVIELIVTPLLQGIGFALDTLAHNDFGKTLQHIPDWFLGTNLGAVVSHAGKYPIGLASDPGPDLALARVLIVSLVYCAIFFGGSYLLLSRRDVTE
jgi:ABC-2 type transport system permease protein